ncbi:MAG TPA: hypothetical protein DCR40_02530 [Prolixibacteraceae bacterium]|nr:hypothetical protein [Prolixibacteraceae bacterium]
MGKNSLTADEKVTIPFKIQKFKAMKKVFGCFLFLVCGCMFCSAQQVVSSGGYEKIAGITVDWVLGGSLTDITFYNLSTLTEIPNEQLPGFGTTIKVYPTVTERYTTIEISPFDSTRFFLEIYNHLGMKIIDRIIINQPVLQVNMSKFSSGLYYLKVFVPGNKQPVKIEKIVKI